MNVPSGRTGRESKPGWGIIGGLTASGNSEAVCSVGASAVENRANDCLDTMGVTRWAAFGETTKACAEEKDRVSGLVFHVDT